MGRVSGVPVNVYTGLGDLAYGGAGTPTGYQNVATNARGVIPQWTFGNGALAFDENDGTQATPWSAVEPLGVDLLAPFRIGRWRVRQSDSVAARAPRLVLESSPDNVTWTARDPIDAVFLDSGNRLLAAPIVARYWRVRVVQSGAGEWTLSTLELHEVTTVGAGNPTRLAPPAERRVMGYDPDAGVPEWQARGAAIADLGAGTAAAPAAYVGVDVAAAGPAQVALLSELNDLRTVVAALRVDRDADRAALNALLARVRAAGILAP